MKYTVKKKFILFSISFFLLISVIAITAYTISTHQINHSYIEQQLSIASETMRLRLAKTVNTELALVLKMADTPSIRQYFENPSDPELESLAFTEFELYRLHFENKTDFWINDIDKIFYSTGNEPYVLNPEDPESYWYNLTLYHTEIYNFNINYNPDIQQIFLWVNVPVFTHQTDAAEEKKPLGMLGTGINLTEFSDFIVNSYRNFDEHITPYTFNKLSEITSAADHNLINEKIRLDDHLGKTGAEIIKIAAALPEGEDQSFIYNNKMFLISYIPEMEWYLVLCYPLPGFLALNQSMNSLFFSMLFLILFILIVINIFIARSEDALEKQNLQLIEANEKAEIASRAKSSFLATMSHEIRTPMNAIIGISQIQMQKENLPEDYATALHKIYSSGSGLLGIINDILDMSKIETGKLNLNPIDYDTPSLINDAVQLNIVRIGAKPIEFKLEINEDLPSRMYGDELRLKQILNNLLSNAIKYTEKGYVKLSVNHKRSEDNIMLCFSIEDTGQGMKSEDQAQLFSGYSRFNMEANRNPEGTGIGLNITRNLVEMMQGTINVQSEYGKGSVFSVEVRQKAVECGAIGADLAQRLRTFTFADGRQASRLQILREPMPYGNVLVVDDLDTNLYVAEGLLTPYKLVIETATSGFAVIEKIENGKSYDVIFMDHMMPRMDGIETTQKLRELGYTGIIVALTANALVGNDEMFAQKGFDGFIPKPIDIRQLNMILNRFVRDRHPDEAKKYIPEITTDAAYAAEKEIDPKIKKIFCEDARKAIAALKETIANDDVKLFTITAHAMKSALANVGEPEASKAAAALESAGSKGDKNFISANTENFIAALEKQIEKFSAQPLDNKDEPYPDLPEDVSFLNEQLQIIKTACSNYDDDQAYAALDRLKEKSWRRETANTLDQIRDMLFVYSDFDGALKRADSLMAGRQ